MDTAANIRLRSTIAVFVGLVFCAQPARSACAPGTNCYCDKVKNPADPGYDPALLFCEDFEAPTLINNQGFGNGAPYYGPWYDDTGLTGDRGRNSYWNRKYGNGAGYRLGQPASPTFGTPCNFSQCTGMLVWDPANRWDGNAFNPRVAFYTQDSDFTSELGSLTPPANAKGGGNGVFDGNATLGWRIPPNGTHGIQGHASFAPVMEIGLTMAMAYPVNSLTSGIWGTTGVNAAWKHNEWTTVNSPNCGFDGLFAFYNQQGPRSGIPFAGFIGAFGANCSGGGYSGTVIDQTAGKAELIGGGLGIYWNSPSNYNQPVDWPLGTWGCVRGHIVIGSTTERYRVWFQGPNMTSERLLIDVSFTKSTLDNIGGYKDMAWNAYANTNQGGGYTPSTALTFRYEDNLHARQGLPVSCAQIGFAGGTEGDTLPPAEPRGLRLL